MAKVSRKVNRRTQGGKNVSPLSMCLSATSFKSIFWWLLLLAIVTMIMFFGLGSLYTETVIASIEKRETASAATLYRSQTRLADQLGKTWQVVLFKQVYPGQGQTLNLRLVGFPGYAELIHPQPLKITTATGKVFKVADVFLEEAPAPTIGQYDFQDILSKLPTEPLVLSIPQPGDRSIDINVPHFIVQEWQRVASDE